MLLIISYQCTECVTVRMCFFVISCQSFVAGTHYKVAAESRPSKATNVEGASEMWLPATPTDGRVRATWSAAVYDSKSWLVSIQEHDSDHLHAVCCIACSWLRLWQWFLPGTLDFIMLAFDCKQLL